MKKLPSVDNNPFNREKLHSFSCIFEQTFLYFNFCFNAQCSGGIKSNQIPSSPTVTTFTLNLCAI